MNEIADHQSGGNDLEDASSRVYPAQLIGRTGMLSDVLVRLEQTLRQEIDELHNDPEANITPYIEAKSRFLLYLECLSHAQMSAMTPELGARVAKTRDAIARNMQVLQNHVSASRDLVDTMTQSLHAAQSDGTYARPQMKGR